MRNNEASGSALMRVFKFGAREKLQNETARIFYTRITISFARNPHYVKTFTMVANSNLYASNL